MSEKNLRIPKRIASAVINSLKGGVVPRVGLPYITVGRKAEIKALLNDVDIISEGGASFRFIVGNYGSGKSFLLQTMRNNVMDRDFVVVDADLSPERRLFGTKGQGLALYKELIKNMSTKTVPEGGALQLILDRWINGIMTETAAETDRSSPDFSACVEKKIYAVINSVKTMVNGFAFAELLTKYYNAIINDDTETKSNVLKWFSGEYSTKTEARKELGVNVIITDDNWYDDLKIFAEFLKLAGYSGMLILIDELVNIYKLPNRHTRESNYEKILTMYNDTLQGKARYIGIIMSGTPQCIEDKWRGVFSYDALRSRLEDGCFGREGIRDMMAPIIRLEPLTSEEMVVLAEKLADIHADLYKYERRFTEADAVDFVRMKYSCIGADSRITPREVIRGMIELLNISYQHPETDIGGLLDGIRIDGPVLPNDDTDADESYAEFEI